MEHRQVVPHQTAQKEQTDQIQYFQLLHLLVVEQEDLLEEILMLQVIQVVLVVAQEEALHQVVLQ